MKKLIILPFVLCAISFAQTNVTRMLSGVNPQSGTTYTFVASDATKTVTFSNASPVAVTLPAGATSGFGAGSIFDAVNLGAGAVTITCSGCTINGAATFSLPFGQSVSIRGDGTNYIAAQGGGSGGGGSGTVQPGVTGQTGYYPGTGTTISPQSNLTFAGSSSNFTGTATFATDGTHAGAVQLLGQTLAPALASNSAAVIGPASASFTSYGLQFPATAPVNGSAATFGTPVSGISAMTFQPKPVINVLDQGVTCDGVTDDGAALNAIFSNINGKEVDFPQNCQIKTTIQLVIQGQTGFVLHGNGTRSALGGFIGPVIYGCNAAASGSVLYINRSGYGKVEGLSVTVRGPSPCNTSTFDTSIQVDSTGNPGVTTHQITFDHMALTTSAQGGNTPSNYRALAITDGGKQNGEMISISNSKINCQNALTSIGIDIENGTSDQDKALNNSIDNCFIGIKHASGNMRIIGNLFSNDGAFSVFGNGGGVVWVSACSSGPIYMGYNESTDGGQFINSNNDAGGGVGCNAGFNLIGNDIQVSDYDTTKYPINLGTSSGVMVVEGNQISLTQTPTTTVIGSASQGSSGPQGTMYEWGNTLQNTKGGVFGICCQIPGYSGGQFQFGTSTGAHFNNPIVTSTMDQLNYGSVSRGALASPLNIFRSIGTGIGNDDWCQQNVTTNIPTQTSSFLLSHCGGATGNAFFAVNGLFSAVNASQIAAPDTPVVTPVGGTASTSYTYVVVANTKSNGSVAGSTRNISNGSLFANLSSTIYNQLIFGGSSGATSYDIYRTVGGTTQGKIGSVSANMFATTVGGYATNVALNNENYLFKDTGLAGDGTSLPTVNTTGYITGLERPYLDATLFCTNGFNMQTSSCNSGTMCDAISAAIASPVALNEVIDARGFGNLATSQYCQAAPAFLYGGQTLYTAIPNTVLLPATTIYLDGPSGASYTDGGTSAVGTPAWMIPSYTRIVGLGTKSTTITICTGVGTPISKCTHAFPQRSLGTVTSTVVVGNVMTVNTTGVTLTSNTNLFVGENIQLVGLATASNNINRTVQTIPTTSSFTINVPTGTLGCAATCGGTAYAFTPIIGFAPGVGGGPMLPVQSVSAIQGFGQYFGHILIKEQGNQADASNFTGYGVTAIQNVNGGDQTVVEDIELNFNTGMGFDIGPGSTDSQYSNLRQTNLSDTHAVPSTVGLYTAGAHRGIDGYAIIGSGQASPKINACIMVDGAFPTQIQNGHAEACIDEFQFAPNSSVVGVKLNTHLGAPSGIHSSTNLVHMLAGTNCASCSLDNLTRQTATTNTILDDPNGNAITDSAVSQYHTDVNGNVAFTTALKAGNTFAGHYVDSQIGVLNASDNLQVNGSNVPSDPFATIASGQTANYNAGSAQTVFTPTTNVSLRVCVSEYSVNVPTGATLPSLTLAWTDISGTAQTQVLLTATSAVSTKGAYATNGVNASSAAKAGVCADPIVTNTSTPVTVTSAGYAAGSGTALSYALSISVSKYN